MAAKTAVIKHIQGVTFIGKTDSNHWITMDGPENFGGSDAGIRPKELLLLSLGGCTASDVAVILNKKKIKLDNFEMNISADIQETHPQVYTKIHLEYVFYGKTFLKMLLKELLNFHKKLTAVLRQCCKKRLKLPIRIK
jgi:putative redox protein